MYLDFIADIAKIGDTIHITCQKEVYEGTIVKIAPPMIAIRLNNGALVVKKDDEIDDLYLEQLTSNTSGEDISDKGNTSSEKKDAEEKSVFDNKTGL